MLVDVHCHVSQRWYEPVDTLLFNMDRCGVDKAVLVQMLGSTDSHDMASARNAHPDRFAFIGAINPDGPDPVAAIEAEAEIGAIGLRMRAGWRSKGDDPLALWRKVHSAGMAVSVVGPVAGLTDGKLAEIATALPELPLIVEHLGGLARPDAGDRAAALPQVIALAEHANISIKLPGLGQLAPRRPDLDSDIPPLDLNGVEEMLAALVAAYGPDRLMWGSDFPPVASREGYANALNWTRDMAKQMDESLVDPIFGGNASRIFRL